MTQKEMRSNRIEILNSRLAQRLESIVIDGSICFFASNGAVCRLDSIGNEYNALVIEYADNLEMAKKGIFGEDGDLFYMDEMSEDEMFEAMIGEIEN